MVGRSCRTSLFGFAFSGWQPQLSSSSATEKFYGASRVPWHCLPATGRAKPAVGASPPLSQIGQSHGMLRMANLWGVWSAGSWMLVKKGLEPAPKFLMRISRMLQGRSSSRALNKRIIFLIQAFVSILYIIPVSPTPRISFQKTTQETLQSLYKSWIQELWNGRGAFLLLPSTDFEFDRDAITVGLLWHPMGGGRTMRA